MIMIAECHNGSELHQVRLVDTHSGTCVLEELLGVESNPDFAEKDSQGRYLVTDQVADRVYRYISGLDGEDFEAYYMAEIYYG